LRWSTINLATINWRWRGALGWLLFLLVSARVIGQPLSRDEIVAIQLTLDDAGFSPGRIDGSWGKMSQQALAAWQQAHDLPATGEFDPATTIHFPAQGAIYTNVSIDGTATNLTLTIPEDWRERSQLSAMGFTTLVEMLAERAHASEGLIKTLNPDLAHDATTATLPNHAPVKITKASRLRVSLAQKTIAAFDPAGKLIALFPCSIAADQEKRPVGQLTVQTVAFNPDYTFDPANFPELDEQQKSYGKLRIPPGPNNPVGTAWIGLSRPGYGIHGTPHPEQIGKTFSHGCFRLANWNAERLAQMVTSGTPVEVVE